MKLYLAPLAGAALVLMLAGGATAQDRSAYDETRGWQVYSISEGNSFLRCGATPQGASPQIAVEYSQEGWALAVPGTAPKDELRGTLQIDGAKFKGTLYDGGDQMIWFLSDEALRSLRNGSKLALQPDTMSVQRLGLAGSAAALLKVRECHANGGLRPKASPLAESGTGGKSVPPAVRVWPKDAARPPTESDAARFGKGCPAWGQFASGPSALAAKARFMNKSDRAVSVYWLDFRGRPVEYAALLPGEEFRADTFEGHVWIAKDFAGECLGGGALFPRQGKKNKFELR